MKKTVFWDFELCSLVEIERRFRSAITLMMETVGTTETSVSFCYTTWSNITLKNYT